MAIQTWFTQPLNGGFSSFYMYDNVTHNFVRIRLELNRKTTEVDNGYTKIIKRSKRVVAFNSGNEKAIFTNNQIHILGHPVPYNYPPEADQRVYDCSPGRTVHVGNLVTFEPILPTGIDAMVLHTIAKHYITGNDTTVDLTPSNDTPQALIESLKREHNKAI